MGRSDPDLKENSGLGYAGAPGGFERSWSEFERLLAVAERSGLKALSVSQLKRFALLYRAATTQLARMRTLGGSAGYLNYLNSLAARAHALLYGTRRKGEVLKTVLLAPLIIPQVVRSTLRYHLIAFLLFAAGGLYGYFGARSDPDWALNFVMPGDPRTPFATREELHETLTKGRYSDELKAPFAAMLWQHNTKVGLLAFFSGILAAVPTVMILFFNGALLGVYSATFHLHGLAFQWWAWILPHGVTEIMAVVLLGGGGLLLGKTVLVSGEGLSRREALRRIRGPALYLLLAAFPLFLFAAVVESYIRQSQLSDTARFVFAATTAVLWVLYFVFVRPTPSHLARATEKTQAELFVPMPRDEELLSALGLVRSGGRRTFPAGLSECGSGASSNGPNSDKPPDPHLQVPPEDSG